MYSSLDEFADQTLSAITDPREEITAESIALLEAMRKARGKPAYASASDEHDFLQAVRGETGLLGIIQKIAESLTATFPERLQAYFKSKARIAGVSTRDIFGFFAFDKPTGYSVIVISTGYMLLLNKLTKFDQVCRDPSSILYCNRYELHELDKKKIEAMRDDVIAQYLRNDARGPIIIVKDEPGRMLQLLTKEAFIVAHEIAHFLDECIFNGGLSQLMISQSANPIENSAHASELAADALGLYLLMRSGWVKSLISSKADKPGNEDQYQKLETTVICSTLCYFFDYLLIIGHKESPSHPHPLARIENALWWNYGEDVAQAYFKWREGGQYPDWAALPKTNAGQDAFAALIEQAEASSPLLRL